MPSSGIRIHKQMTNELPVVSRPRIVANPEVLLSFCEQATYLLARSEPTGSSVPNRYVVGNGSSSAMTLSLRVIAESQTDPAAGLPSRSVSAKACFRQPRVKPRQIGEHWPTHRDESKVGSTHGSTVVRLGMRWCVRFFDLSPMQSPSA